MARYQDEAAETIWVLTELLGSHPDHDGDVTISILDDPKRRRPFLSAIGSREIVFGAVVRKASFNGVNAARRLEIWCVF